MHTSRELRSTDFRITVAGRPAAFEAVFPGFTDLDRLGVVIGADYGAAGASTVILAAVTAFYDRLRERGGAFFAYPDFFAFHVGHRRGILRKLDVFPDHKEVVVPADPEQILRAVNDRGVTGLLVPETGDIEADTEPEGDPGVEPATRASAERRIRASLSYSPTGRVRAPDVLVRGSARTESYVAAMLATKDPAARSARVARAALGQGEPPVESFRRVTLSGALHQLAGAAAASVAAP
jgi:hypothetical protein